MALATCGNKVQVNFLLQENSQVTASIREHAQSKL